MRTAIYMSAHQWEGADSMDLPEQSAVTKQYMRDHADLKKISTTVNRNTVRDTETPLEEVLAAAENRELDCILIPTLSVFFDCAGEANIYINYVMVPAGIRLIAVKEQYDSHDPDAGSILNKEVYRRERRKADGKSQQKE